MAAVTSPAWSTHAAYSRFHREHAPTPNQTASRRQAKSASGAPCSLETEDAKAPALASLDAGIQRILRSVPTTGWFRLRLPAKGRGRVTHPQSVAGAPVSVGLHAAAVRVDERAAAERKAQEQRHLLELPCVPLATGVVERAGHRGVRRESLFIFLCAAFFLS